MHWNWHVSLILEMNKAIQQKLNGNKQTGEIKKGKKKQRSKCEHNN